MNDPKDIVAFMIGTRITNDVGLIQAASNAKPIERRRFSFMAACGLGEPWDGLSKAPALVAGNRQGEGAVE